MPKSAFGGIFQARRKSSGNAIEDGEPLAHPTNGSPAAQSGGFRILDRTEIERAKQEAALKKQQERSSKFGRFSGFGASGNKGRNQSIDEESPSSSKRDSKSSSGTQSFTSRPYHPGDRYYGGSSSTLPSSAESDMNENMFSNLPPRPHLAQHSSNPHSLSMTGMVKQLPALPASRSNDAFVRSGPLYSEQSTTTNGRSRAMTTSSYASTAIAPRLEADLDFGGFGDDMFTSTREESPELTTNHPAHSSGRSLLQNRRPFQAEPISINPKMDVEPPLTSWESRTSGEGEGAHLMASTVASPIDDSDMPPPVPKHKYSQKAQYTQVASYSPELNGSGGWEDTDAKLVSQSGQARTPRRAAERESSPEHSHAYESSSSAASLQTPLTSRSASNTTTPRAALRASNGPLAEDDEDNIFAQPKKDAVMQKPNLPVMKENIPPPAIQPAEGQRRVLTAAEFQAHQRAQLSQPVEDSSSDEDDYDDEEDAIRKREEEQKLIRQRQQMQIAREHMRRSTTGPVDSARASTMSGPLSNGFPSETSMEADQWDDEDVPLGVLAQHGFPSRNRAPTQPANATPSYFRTSSPAVPDRPASTGATSNRASTFRPPFARNLPDDPYANFVGGGLVQQANRDPMGFSRGAASVYNEPVGMPADVQPQYTSLVDQIQMRDNAKQKYMGGASSKKPSQGPFTGTLSNQMNMTQQANPTRMSTMGMPGMPGMAGAQGIPGMNPMMNMNMMGGPMPMMGMNPMQYPMYPQNELMMQQMYQQMLQMQQQMHAQNTMFGQPPHMQQNPRMSMALPQQNPGFQNPQFQNNNFLNVGTGGPNPAQRPMSIMSFGGSQVNPSGRPYSTQAPPGMPQIGGLQPPMGMNNGYTPSIAPSERSNIGLSARYRPVVTGNGMQDTHSTVSSMTLQASGGAVENRQVKGILKKKTVPQVTVREDDEDDWGKMNARKSKFVNGGAKKDDDSGIGEMIRGFDNL